jgi:acyl-CoA thioester hydrolase
MEQARTTPVQNATCYRVIYGDTDRMGVVYYANYLRWFERGRSEFLRQIGYPYSQIEDQGYHFPVTEVSCRYLRSVRYDDVITIETRLTAVGRATLHFGYRISSEADEALATGSTQHACLDATGQIARIPADLARRLSTALTAPTTPKNE